WIVSCADRNVSGLLLRWTRTIFASSDSTCGVQRMRWQYQVISTVPVGQGPLGVAVTPDGRKVYVANQAGGNGNGVVSVISTATFTVSTITDSTLKPPSSVAVAPDGTRVYVANGPNTVSVISTATDTVVGPPITVGVGPIQVAVTPDGRK